MPGGRRGGEGKGVGERSVQRFGVRALQEAEDARQAAQTLSAAEVRGEWARAGERLARQVADREL